MSNVAKLPSSESSMSLRLCLQRSMVGQDKRTSHCCSEWKGKLWEHLEREPTSLGSELVLGKGMVWVVRERLALILEDSRGLRWLRLMGLMEAWFASISKIEARWSQEGWRCC